MYPLRSIPKTEYSSYPPKLLVGNYWKLKNKALRSSKKEQQTNQDNPSGVLQPAMGLKVYLSTSDQVTSDFIIDEFRQKYKSRQKDKEKEEEKENDFDLPPLPDKRNLNHDSILLWEESAIGTPSLSKTFLLMKESTPSSSSSSTSSSNNGHYSNESSPSFIYATQWLDDQDRKEEAMQGHTGISAILSSAGDGIESTSVLLSLWKGIGKSWTRIFGKVSKKNKGVSNDQSLLEQQQQQQQGGKDPSRGKRDREVITIPSTCSIWKHLMNNSTVNVRVLITREGRKDVDYKTTLNHLLLDEKRHDLLVGGVDLVKYDLPHHIHKAKRYLYKDLVYIVQRYILGIGKATGTGSQQDEQRPWDMSLVKPKEYELYQMAMDMKKRGVGYPYWKPEVAVKLVSEDELYPLNYVGHSQMDVIKVESHLAGRKPFESGHAYLPGLYVDEMGLTSEKYIPLNRTVDALPLRISFDSGESVGDEGGGSTGGLSPGRWRLLRHLSAALESQKELGFDQSDIDDVKRLIADTNVMLLGITVMASALHLLFEFLTFKNDVEFWRSNKDLTGLSVRALFMDFFSQTIILLYLIEKESSLLMTIPAACGCLIALWKAQRGSGLKFVKASKEKNVNTLNKILRIVGIELHATRLRAAASKTEKRSGDGGNLRDLAALSEETDALATRLLGKYLMFPLVLGYTFHTLINEEHSGWYSWFITSASSAMYGLGFVFMTPQLFLNYKLKSVAHLPWKVLGYRFINTFIDDLFAFIIRMPTMARISCFRDDIIFFIYLWQRYLYPVDTSRPIEGGGMDALSAAASTAVVEDDKKVIGKAKKEQ